MSRSWLGEVFGTSQPIIGMVHLPPLPGSPGYDADRGISGIIEWTERDLAALQDGGIDAVMFCNENDRPYAFRVDRVVPATMARVIGELRSRIRVPFGVDILWDPCAAIALAQATGARFVREVFTGVYESDMGLWSPDAAAALRYRRQIGADQVKLLFNVSAEFASPIGGRSPELVARSVVFSSIPDAICVSGMMTGSAVDTSLLERMRESVGDFPVFANTGVKASTLRDQFRFADGCVVGTSLKRDGITWNPVDPNRVQELMAVAREIRGQ